MLPLQKNVAPLRYSPNGIRIDGSNSALKGAPQLKAMSVSHSPCPTACKARDAAT